MARSGRNAGRCTNASPRAPMKRRNASSIVSTCPARSRASATCGRPTTPGPASSTTSSKSTGAPSAPQALDHGLRAPQALLAEAGQRLRAAPRPRGPRSSRGCAGRRRPAWRRSRCPAPARARCPPPSAPARPLDRVVVGDGQGRERALHRVRDHRLGREHAVAEEGVRVEIDPATAPGDAAAGASDALQRPAQDADLLGHVRVVGLHGVDALELGQGLGRVRPRPRAPGRAGSAGRRRSRTRPGSVSQRARELLGRLVEAPLVEQRSARSSRPSARRRPGPRAAVRKHSTAWSCSPISR